jgi:hypothetical protein
MAAPSLFFADLVRESCTASGTGPLILGGALPGHRAFAGTVPVASLFHYCIAGVADPAQWEAGTGRLMADGRLERVSVAASSNAGALVNFGAGLKTVALTVGAGWFTGATVPQTVAEVTGLTAELAARQPVSTSHATGTIAVAGDLLTVRRGAGWTNVPVSNFLTADASGRFGIGGAATSTLHVQGGAARLSGSEAGVSLFYANALRHSGTAPTFVDFNSGGTAGAVNFRNGNGFVTQLVLEGAGHVRPGGDNSQSLGVAGQRWSVIFAGSGTINTSDARDKRDIESLPETWLDAWGAVGWRRFRFRDGKRWHAGLIAQEVEAAFAGFGIDAFAIGLLCRDAIKGGRGRKDRWGLRYEECLALEAAWQRREIARLSARLSKRRVRQVTA